MKQSSVESGDTGVYLSLRLDGRVRASGKVKYFFTLHFKPFTLESSK